MAQEVRTETDPPSLSLCLSPIAQGLLAQNEKIELPTDFGASRKRKRTSVAGDETEYLDAMLDDLHTLETTYVFLFFLFPVTACIPLPSGSPRAPLDPISQTAASNRSSARPSPNGPTRFSPLRVLREEAAARTKSSKP